MKLFPLGDILSITTGRLLSANGIAGVYDIQNYMTGESLYTHQLGRAMESCGPALLKQHPALTDVDVSGITTENWRAWMETQIARFGERLPVEPLKRGEYLAMDPLDELATMVPKEKIIVVKPKP